MAFRVARAFEAELPRVPDLDGASVGSARDGVRRSRVARASATATTEDADDRGVVVIELVADRFLRKLVRCLCATAAREAASHAGDDEYYSVSRKGVNDAPRHRPHPRWA